MSDPEAGPPEREVGVSDTVFITNCLQGLEPTSLELGWGWGSSIVASSKIKHDYVLSKNVACVIDYNRLIQQGHDTGCLVL